MKSLTNNIAAVFMIMAALLIASCTSDPFAEPDSSGKFIKFFGDVNDEDGFAIVETDNGQFIFTGNSNSGTNGDQDIFIGRVDGNGNSIWQKRLELANDQNSYDIEIIENGNSLIFGSTTLDNGTTDFFLVEIDGNGEVVGEPRQYGDSTKDEEGLDIIPSASGGYLLVGTVSSTIDGEEDKDMLIVKIDINGNVMFQNTYGLRSKIDEVTAVVETAMGNLVWCGTLERDANNKSMRVVSTDSLGGLRWDYTYEEEISNVQSIATDIKKITGGYIITGKSFVNQSESNVLLLNISDNGVFKWSADLSSPLAQQGNSVAKTNDGGYVVAGQTSTAAGTNDIYLVKTNSLGTLLWSKTFGWAGDDVGSYVTESSDRGIIVLGTATISNNKVIQFLKTDEEGHIPGDGLGN